MKHHILKYLNRTPEQIKGDRACRELEAAHKFLDDLGISRCETYLTDEDELKMKYFSLVERFRIKLASQELLLAATSYSSSEE